jgi:hypothetical protein
MGRRWEINIIEIPSWKFTKSDYDGYQMEKWMIFQPRALKYTIPDDATS